MSSPLTPSLWQPLEGFVFTEGWDKAAAWAGVSTEQTAVFDQTHYQSPASEIREGGEMSKLGAHHVTQCVHFYRLNTKVVPFLFTI